MDRGNQSQVNDVLDASQTDSSDDFVLNIVIIAIRAVASGTISFFGILFNAINIIVFCKQGFKDSVNITLFSLAIADTGGLLTLLAFSIFYNPWFVNADLSIGQQDVAYLVAAWPHVTFTRITSAITAVATFERCLCIALPLKVRAIITPRRTVMVVVGIFVCIIASVVPVYFSVSLGPKFFSERNQTKIGLVYTSNALYIENISLSLNAVFQISAFLGVTICTIILVQNLLQKSKWRQLNSNSANQEAVSNRDKKVVKMILFISVIFIVCLLPGTVNIIAQFTTEKYNITDEYRNLYILTWTICNSLEGINSTVNIFVYYNLSSKYKEIMDKMFNRNKD